MLRKHFLLRSSRCRFAAVAALFLVPFSVHADASVAAGERIFEESFEKFSPKSAPGKPWTASLRGESGNGIEVVADTQNRFENGRSNQILEFRKIEAGPSQALITQNAFSAEIAKIGFRFYQPDDGHDGYSWLILYAGSRSTDNRAQVITIGRNGSLAGSGGLYERGRVHDVVFIVNNSSRPTAYGNGETVAAGSVDIWIDGERTHSGFSSQNNRRGALTGFEFNIAGGKRFQQFFIDDLTIESLAHKPVPVGVVEQPATHPPLAPVDGKPSPSIRRRWSGNTKTAPPATSSNSPATNRFRARPASRTWNFLFTTIPKRSRPAPGSGVTFS